MIINKIYNTFFFCILLFITLGCEKKEADVEMGPIGQLSGEWWVRTYINNEPSSDYNKLLTFNVASGMSDSMWLSGAIYYPYSNSAYFDKILLKSKANTMGLTFSNELSLNNNENFEVNFKIDNGKVLLNATQTPTLLTVDSIYLELQLVDTTWYGLTSDDVIKLAGYRRTGWAGDDF